MANEIILGKTCLKLTCPNETMSVYPKCTLAQENKMCNTVFYNKLDKLYRIEYSNNIKVPQLDITLNEYFDKIFQHSNSKLRRKGNLVLNNEKIYIQPTYIFCPFAMPHRGMMSVGNGSQGDPCPFALRMDVRTDMPQSGLSLKDPPYNFSFTCKRLNSYLCTIIANNYVKSFILDEGTKILDDSFTIDNIDSEIIVVYTPIYIKTNYHKSVQINKLRYTNQMQIYKKENTNILFDSLMNLGGIKESDNVVKKISFTRNFTIPIICEVLYFSEQKSKLNPHDYGVLIKKGNKIFNSDLGLATIDFV